MKILIFGSSGMLGGALKNALSDWEIIAPSHTQCDLLDVSTLLPLIVDTKPEVVINSAAIVNIESCEKEKQRALTVNALAVAEMAKACNACNAQLVQISTDHYYVNDAFKKHGEEEPIHLINYYAMTKYMGEVYAILAEKHLIIRTNIVGFKHNAKQPTFLEWAIEKITNKEKMDLFTDYFTSSIDIYHFSEILKALIMRKICGTYNVGANAVLAKSAFIEKLALGMGIPLYQPNFCSVTSNKNLVNRASSLGLDVTKVETALNQSMPSPDAVIEKILEVYHNEN